MVKGKLQKSPKVLLHKRSHLYKRHQECNSY